MSTIILTGGGTAGHVTPLLTILPFLQNKFDKIYYVGSGKEIERSLMQNKNVEIFNVNSPAFKRSFCAENLLIPVRLFRAVVQCKSFLIKTKPKVIFSKGGYTTLPICIAAKQLKIPVVCHESDLSLGLANKLVYKNSILLTTFDYTAQKYGGICVGPPLNYNDNTLTKEQARKKLGIKNSKPVLLITGGSQGSMIINNAIWKNLNEILNSFNLIHLYGKNNKCPYNAINGYFPFAFTNMSDCIKACDICVSRGGSNTIFELLHAKTPSLIVPLKRGSRGDQIKNAKHFQNKNLVLYCDENDFEKSPIKYINELYFKKDDLLSNLKNYHLSSGSEKIANILLDYLDK